MNEENKSSSGLYRTQCGFQDSLPRVSQTSAMTFTCTSIYRFSVYPLTSLHKFSFSYTIKSTKSQIDAVLGFMCPLLTPFLRSRPTKLASGWLAYDRHQIFEDGRKEVFLPVLPLIKRPISKTTALDRWPLLHSWHHFFPLSFQSEGWWQLLLLLVSGPPATPYLFLNHQHISK